MIPHLTQKILYPAAIFGTIATVILAPPNIAYSLSPYDIGAIAKKITVKIQGQSAPGSGVIIAKQGNTYYVLTAGHVIKGTNPGEQADITTHNGKVHELDTKKIIFFPDVDLALLQFTSEENYTTAEIGESDKLQELSMVYVADYPLSGETISGGKFTINDGKISSINFSNEGGYDLVYNNATITGMSGGPVLNEEGQLVAIHGRAEEKKGGFNLGIPIKLFIVSAADVGINIQ